MPGAGAVSSGLSSVRLPATESNFDTRRSATHSPRASSNRRTAPCQKRGGSPRRAGSTSTSAVEPAAAAPLVTPEESTFLRTMPPPGRRARQSVNVPPTSIQNCQRSSPMGADYPETSGSSHSPVHNRLEACSTLRMAGSILRGTGFQPVQTHVALRTSADFTPATRAPAAPCK